MAKSKVIVGMSGGVDSSVAAYLLQQQGHDVHGLFMKNWEEDDTDEYCSASQDLADVERVCDKLGLPYSTVNFASEYWDRVFEYFLHEYRAGRTPNPDVLCNREIKFRAFLDHAMTLGADWIATGHYVATSLNPDTTVRAPVDLLKGRDPNKDQSYFLYLLDQSQLRHALFPLGTLHKNKVRDIAKQLDLPNADKKDSTGICFIGERPFKQFLQQYLPAQPGDIVDDNGKRIGRHEGLMYYTIGQRQGLGIGGQSGSSHDPWYVMNKNLQTNELIVVQGAEHPGLYKTSLQATQMHWIRGQAPDFPLSCHAKIRYRQTDQRCLVTAQNDTSYKIDFEQPQRAVTPGQSVVFYDDTICLGGGIITG